MDRRTGAYLLCRPRRVRGISEEAARIRPSSSARLRPDALNTAMSVLRNHEDPVVTAIREALGAVAVGEPTTYWLYAEGAGEWCVRREGSSAPERFANRDEALAFARLAVARCSSYCLYLQ